MFNILNKLESLETFLSKMNDNNVKKLCGCCLSVDNLVDITKDVINLIVLCFSIQILKFSSNESPTFICTSCKEKIKDCYNFRCQILDSQTELKKLNVMTNLECELKIESDCPIFKFEDSIKEEVLTDIDDPIDADDSIAQYQSDESDFTNTKLKTESFENDLRKEYRLTSKAKKRLLVKKTNSKKRKRMISNLIEKKRAYPSNSLPYKLDKEALTCEVCNEKFKRHILLQSHMAVHYPNFICDVCGKPFVLKKVLQNHIRIHNQESVPCSICKKLLKPSYLRVHMQTHTDGVKRYVCPHCGKRFPSLHQRVKHLENVHNVDIYTFHCKFCSKKFILSSFLSAHIRRCHTKELNMHCEICGKGFYSTSEFKNHKITHTGEKNYQCDICSKSFTKKWSLTLHMRTHTGSVIKHKCIHCGKEFTQNGSLRVHIKNIHEKKAIL